MDQNVEELVAPCRTVAVPGCVEEARLLEFRHRLRKWFPDCPFISVHLCVTCTMADRRAHLVLAGLWDGSKTL